MPTSTSKRHNRALLSENGGKSAASLPVARITHQDSRLTAPALDQLRDGVQAALVTFGTGFVDHRANDLLRTRLASGALPLQDFYRQLLRLAYRLIFLFIAEDRDLLLDPAACPAAKARFAQLHSTKRLRNAARSDQTAVQRGKSKTQDAGWQALRLLMQQLDGGCPDLALPALGGFLWGHIDLDGRRLAQALPDLDAASLTNVDLCSAVDALCSARDGAVCHCVQWASVQAAELGSVYEALMERVPRLHGAKFELTTAAGNERKTTGSYYTPAVLVQRVLDSALDPVVDDACQTADPEQAILGLKVLDPACGSGHFAVAAARRLAQRLARVRSGDAEPSPPELQRALLDVIRHCIYGVDINPMAVELCKWALWLETSESSQLLAALDPHLQCGNALLGVTPELLENRDTQGLLVGIPEAAFVAQAGDDKAVASALRKRNKVVRREQAPYSADNPPVDPIDPGNPLHLGPDSDNVELATLPRTAVDYTDYVNSEAYLHAKQLADAWCAAFVGLKVAGAAALTNAEFLGLRQGLALSPATSAEVAQLAAQYQFFHWHLAFPHLFDVIIGNPPYLNQLEAATALNRRAASLLRLRSDGVVGGLADVASAFLSVQSSLVAPGGALALIVPQSFLVAADAAPIRQQLATRLRLDGLWVSNAHAFASASVFTCACSFRNLPQSTAGQLARWVGAKASPVAPLELNTAELRNRVSWSPLFADTLGIPYVLLDNSYKIADWATTTADFRDQYYGLDTFLVDEIGADDSAFPPVVTTGLIDLAYNRWGQRSTQILKHHWAAPRVNRAAMVATGELGDWITLRLTPKVLVATQTKVLEVFCDAGGRFIPSVPLLTVQPRPGVDVWAVGAALASPAVCAWAAAQYAGAALAVGALKLSATQLAGLPVPTVGGQAWAEAVDLFRLAHAAATDQARLIQLVAFGSAALQCYGLDPAKQAQVLKWWRGRLGKQQDPVATVADSVG